MKNYTPKLKRDTCKVGSGGNKYNVGGKRVDEVILRFDEDEQKFYARIVNPSQHTQYLFEHDRLGIMLSRGDIGSRTRLSCFDTNMKHKNYGGNKVKRLYHPRWYGISDSLTRVNDINTETEFPIDISFSPVCHCSWDSDRINFTYVKAVLVSIHTTLEVYRHGGQFRLYHTYCERLKIRWNDDGHIFLRAEKGQSTKRTSVSITSLNDETYKIHFENMGPGWIKAFEQDSVKVVLLITNIGVTCGCHGLQRFTRNLYRDTNNNLAVVGGLRLSQNDDTISITDFGYPAITQQIRSLIRLRLRYNDERNVVIEHVMLGVQIMHNTIVGVTEIPYHAIYPVDSTPYLKQMSN